MQTLNPMHHAGERTVKANPPSKGPAILELWFTRPFNEAACSS